VGVHAHAHESILTRARTSPARFPQSGALTCCRPRPLGTHRPAFSLCLHTPPFSEDTCARVVTMRAAR
jgi:hypothetical protein